MASLGPRDDKLLHQGAGAMKKKFASYLILSLAFSTFLAASLTGRQAAKPWITYTPPAKNFTVQFPVEPNPDHQTLKDGGLITEVFSYISVSSGNGIFFVNYMALNPQATVSADAALKTAQNGLLQTGGAKLLTSTKSEYVRGPNDRLPILEFTGESDTTVVRGSAIFDTDRVYTLANLCSKGQNCSVAAKKFFSSFKLTP